MRLLADPVAEASRVLAAAEDADVTLRAIGGVAIALHAEAPLPDPLRRPYRDIDLVTTPGAGPEALSLMRRLGYQSNDRFNALNGQSRLVLYDVKHERQVDVFVGEFRMCHSIPLVARLDVDRLTIPLAELLLTKLQVVEVNAKDLLDVFALLLEHDVGASDNQTVNADRIASLLAADWGLWRTVRGTLEATLTQLPHSRLDATAQATVAERVRKLWAAVDAAPKTMRWRARARIGERFRWYETPEEIAHSAPGRT